MKDFQAAQDYYDEFVEIAPHDTLKYVLRYDIQKAQGASYEELIPILEELKEQEYTEEWAYELAYLYHKAGMSEKCIDACDELVLWFGDGPYVERALELKMLYQPLTKTQEEKYRSFCQAKDDRAGLTTAAMNYSAGRFDFGDWGNVFFVKNNYPAMVKYDGTEDYKLDPNDHTKKADGKTASG